MKKIISLLITVLLFAFMLCFSASAADKIAAPKKLKATPTTSSVTLKWSEVEGADYYRICYKTSKDGKWKTAVKKTTETKKVLKELPSGKKYYFAVRSFDKTTDGTVYSAMKQVKIATLPKKTAKITAAAKIKRVTLSWKKVDGATHYRVYQKINGEWESLTLTEKTSFTVKELKSGTKYSFAVRAYVKSKAYTVAGAKKSVSVTTKTKEPDNYVAKTDGGVKLYPVTSTEAKEIQRKWGSRFYTYYETKNGDGKILLYSKSVSGWFGCDIKGATYDASGKIMICPYCGKTVGQDTIHCDGSCHMSFS